MRYSWARHIDIKNNFIRDHVENGDFMLKFIDSKINLLTFLQNPG